MKKERHLEFEGGFNIRDLGPIATVDGRKTKIGAAVRSGNLHRLTPAGWEALKNYGIRTIIDLRNADECESEKYVVANSEIARIHFPLEEERQPSDEEFWKRWRGFNCCPLYYTPFVDQYPVRIADLISIIANAKPGGVLFHCGIGRDRTGLIALLLLKLMGATHDEILADYTSSAECLRPHWTRLGRTNDEESVTKLLTENKSSFADAIRKTIAALDEPAKLEAIGISDSNVSALRLRLLESPSDFNAS